MTAKQLEKLGIFKDGLRYWCNVTDSRLSIHKSDNIKDVLKLIHEDAFSQGVVEGKEIRSQEFKDLINNTV